MNISSTRGSLLFVFFLVLIILVSSSMVVAGWNEGQLETKITAPFKSLFSTIQNAMQSSEMREEPSPVPFTSSSEATINKDIEATAESHLVVSTITPIRKEKVYITPTTSVRYVYPTITYPTTVSGAPGSKEWNDDFWKRWENMNQQNTEMQRQVEEAQKIFCENNPSLCH